MYELENMTDKELESRRMELEILGKYINKKGYVENIPEYVSHKVDLLNVYCEIKNRKTNKRIDKLMKKIPIHSLKEVMNMTVDNLGLSRTTTCPKELIIDRIEKLEKINENKENE